MMALDKKIAIHPEGNMNICTKCHGNQSNDNQSNSCRDVLLKTTNVSPRGGAGWIVRGSLKLLGFVNI